MYVGNLFMGISLFLLQFLRSTHLREIIKSVVKILTTSSSKYVNPKGCGGGPKVPGGFLIGCHFSQDYAMVTKIKILDFIHKHPN